MPTQPTASAASGPPMPPEPLRLPKLLVGEGKEEVRFFNSLLKHIGVADVQVDQYGGKGLLDRFLHALPARPGFANLAALGITRDADDGADRAFASICANLRKYGFAVPLAIGRPAVGLPRICVFTLPDGRQPGMLEDLCWSSVAADLAAPCVQQFIECVTNAGRTPSNLAKARVHAWLASKEAPDKRLGNAAEAGYWPFNNPTFDPLKQFIRSL